MVERCRRGPRLDGSIVLPPRIEEKVIELIYQNADFLPEVAAPAPLPARRIVPLTGESRVPVILTPAVGYARPVPMQQLVLTPGPGGLQAARQDVVPGERSIPVPSERLENPSITISLREEIAGLKRVKFDIASFVSLKVWDTNYLTSKLLEKDNDPDLLPFISHLCEKKTTEDYKMEKEALDETLAKRKRNITSGPQNKSAA